MGAATYVGRVGGLAVALGTGFAILTGQGVASADPGDPSESSVSSPADTNDADDTESQDTESQDTESDIEDTESQDDESETGDAESETDNDDSDPDDATAEDDDESPANSKRRLLGNTFTMSTVATEQDSTDTTEEEQEPEPEPQDPPVGTAALTVLATARPEFTSQAVDYDPVIDVFEGVITGENLAPDVASSGEPLNYTILGKPQQGGKAVIDDEGNFSFLPYCTSSGCTESDSFRVLVAETSPLDAFLERSPVTKALVRPIVVQLHRIPIVRDVLAPVIGRSEIYTVVVPVAQFVEEDDNPIAFTTTVMSDDGTPISVNYFPALGLVKGERAPTVLNGPSLATAGYIDPNQAVTVFGLVPGIKPLRAAEYNVVTWDPRGEFASGGVLHLDSPYYEAQDVKAIISWVADQPGTAMDTSLDPAADPDDPLIGMAGGSYGGGIQLSSAGVDQRIDAIAPGIAWNNLTEALYPEHAFKTAWASLLLLSLVSQGSRIDGQIYAGIFTGVTLGVLFPAQQRFLNDNSPDQVVEYIDAPTLFLQGTVDTLFTLQQALDNANQLTTDEPVRMIWYCGGHGACLDLDDAQQAKQTKFLVDQTIAWLDTHVKGEPLPPGPKFTWVDQLGRWHTSDLLPDDEEFSTSSIEAEGDGGALLIVPILGGSGPQNQASFPLSLVSGAKASQAVEVDVDGLPADAEHVYVVGAPQLSFTYSGVGTSRNVYAQIVDNDTGRVIGNMVTPIEVTLDGGTHTVDVPMENIAYTMKPGGKGVTLQIVDSATPFEDFTSYGVIEISDVELDLPVADNVQHLTLEEPLPGELYEPADTPTWEELLLGRR